MNATIVILVKDGSRVWREREATYYSCLDDAKKAHNEHPHLPIALFEDPKGKTGEFWDWWPVQEMNPFTGK
jgi:hypothetical protein